LFIFFLMKSESFLSLHWQPTQLPLSSLRKVKTSINLTFMKQH